MAVNEVLDNQLRVVDLSIRHCPNGHLIFHTLKGSGCIHSDCEYQVVKNGR